MACFWILQEYALADSVWAYSLHYLSSFFIDKDTLASLSVYIRATGLHFLLMVATLAGFVLVLAVTAVVCVCWGKSLALWISFGDPNFRCINVIADLEDICKGRFLSLLLCWWWFYAELHVVDEPTFCHNQLLWLFLHLHLVLPLEHEALQQTNSIIFCLLLWFLLYV